MLGLKINKGVNMDKYTKFILTVIAISLVALNVDFVTPASAEWGSVSLRAMTAELRDIASAIRECR
jgi:hypothetical protein